MDDDSLYSAGDHVARARHRQQMTQEQLAERAGLALNTIKSIERGVRTGRMSTLNRIARALGTTTSALLAPDRGVHITHETTPDALLAIRRALTPPLGITDDREASSRPDERAWQATLTYAERLYDDDRYDALLEAVPVLLDEATAMHAADPARYAPALGHACLYAGKVLTQIRQLDLANHALDKAMRLAHESSDDLLASWVVANQCWTLLLQKRFSEVEGAAVSMAEAIEPSMSATDTARVASWGWLMTKASAAAVRDARVEEADEYMRMAHTAAARVGEDIPENCPPPIARFCETTVGYSETENAVLVGDHARALDTAARIAPSQRPIAVVRNRHRLDVASAHLGEHRTDEAVETLLDVRSAAPEWLRHQGYARGLIGQLVETRRRALCDEVGTLADHVGVAL